MKRKIVNGITVVLIVIGIAFVVSALIPFSLAIPIYLTWMVWKNKTQIFHDQIEPEFAERRLKMMKALLLVALISFVMIMVTVILGVLVFHLPESVVFYIGFFWLCMFAIPTSTSLVIYFKGRRKTKQKQENQRIKSRSILSFTLHGAIGFGLGGAIGGAIWPSIDQPYWGFVVMGAIGAASLGLGLKDWKKALISAISGAIGFGAGSYLSNLIFCLIVGLLGVSLGVASLDWKRVSLLLVVGIIGFTFAIFNTWSMSSGEPFLSALMMAIWGIIGGAVMGATLGYLEKRKTQYIST